MSEENSAEAFAATDSGAASAEPQDAALGDAGKRALVTLRSENKELKARLKALEDAATGSSDSAGAGDPPSDGREAASDVDGKRVATTAENVMPKRPRFEGRGDGGARPNTPLAPQLNRADLRRMTAKQIDAARRNGQLRDLLGGKN